MFKPRLRQRILQPTQSGTSSIAGKALICFEQSGEAISDSITAGSVTRICSGEKIPVKDASVLLLIGSESAEATGTDTLSILFASVMHGLRDRPLRPLIVVQGGMATPEAVAAYLLTGADGVLLESLHWLTDDIPGTAIAKQRITALRADHTRVIGQRLGAPRRFFDKGNSRTVREMESLADALCAAGADDASRQSFIAEIERFQIPALTASFGPDELIPLGTEAAFAGDFIKRFGSGTDAALQAFARSVEDVLNKGPIFLDAFTTNTPAAKTLGTRYPFLQGAMTWITDKPAFARIVAESGALPTLALGPRDSARLDQDFGDLKEVMAGLPYALNILVLSENPFRGEQLAWIEKHRPPFVVIAAGEPSYAERLKAQGLQVIYLCPDEGLLRLALTAGVDFVVLEGSEAGGHIGTHSTQMLAQMALLLKQREPELFRKTHVVLAGGVFDRASALRAAVLGAEAVQMGTVYLASREIVETGALPTCYQRLILEATPGCTAVSGETVGLRVRSLKTPRLESILELESRFTAGSEDEREFRKHLERLSVGTLLVATRQVRQPGDTPLDEETCLKEGQYMSGAVAGCIDTQLDLQNFHRMLAESAYIIPVAAETNAETPIPRSTSATARPSSAKPERIAVTGLALANSLGNDTESFWQASLAMHSGVTEVPASRWDHALYFNADPRHSNTTYSPVGAFMSMPIERRDLWVSPQDFRTMSAAMRLSLVLAQRAIAQAGLENSGIAPERISVIISQNSGEAAGTLVDQVMYLRADEIAGLAKAKLGITAEQAGILKDALREGRMGVDDTSLIGRLNCAAAGHISNRFGFMGPSYSVGAACATSLVALHAAVMLIRQGLIDAAVIGGGEEPLSPAHYLEFSALRALAGLRGQRSHPHLYSRPFDSDRDGFVLGEGGGFLVIERESSARARGVRPLGYITGVGAANNDKGIVESTAESQQVALRLSFDDAGYGPDEVDLVECHATSTMQGDVEEIIALRNIFPAETGVVLAGLKSQIGHTLGASGVTAIGRALLAMRDGILPGTLNVEEPDPAMGLAEYGFRILKSAQRWPEVKRPRRAQVNAFGFGGASFVIHLESAEEHTGFATIPEISRQENRDSFDLGVRAVKFDRNGMPWRAGVVAGSSFAARAALLQIEDFPDSGDRKALAALARKGVFAAPDAPAEPAAMVLSGQGGFYPGMGKALYAAFPAVRKIMDRIAAVADFDLLAVLFEADATMMRQTRWQQPALFTLEYAIARQLMDLGFTPVAMAGHSLGELTALTLAGVMSPEDGFRVVNQRGLCMDQSARECEDPGVMFATDTPCGIVERLAARYDMVVVTNYNSPRQTVFGGLTTPTLELAEELQHQGFRCTRLAVSLAFHSPIMRAATPHFAEFLAGVELHAPGIPVISNVTGAPFPDEPDAIRDIMVKHLETAVQWTGNVHSLWLDFRARSFVEVGPGQVLCNLIGDIFEQATCINTCIKGDEPATLRRGIAALSALGHIELPAELVEIPDQVPAGPSPALKPPVPVSQEKPGNSVLEDVIAIIVDATGYDRSEIEPDMDIRQDLAIRSSRLPVIMDQAEKTFGIVIRIEDFIGVNTVREMAERIAGLSGRTLVGELGSTGTADGTLEQVIAIIMDTTGYERSEIEPDMDIRQDLAIRSSRLPVIMDQAEKTFDIVIRIEDFIGINTVREMACRIDELRPSVKAAAMPRPLPPPAHSGINPPAADRDADNTGQYQPVSRLEPLLEQLHEGSGTLLTLEAVRCVAVVTLDPSSGWNGDVEEYLLKISGSRTVMLQLAAGQSGAVVAELEKQTDLAGIVFVLGDRRDGDASRQLLTDAFAVFQHLLGRLTRRFALAIHADEDGGTGGMLAEGLLGMFLACQLEYASLHLRCIGIDRRTSLDTALTRALDMTGGPVQMQFTNGSAWAPRMVAAGVVPAEEHHIPISPGDVIVLSGGGRGVTRKVALSLAVHRPYLVLLGRSAPGPDSSQLLAELRAAGTDSEYISCDVTDSVAVAGVMEDIAARLGRIDGILHGAGILRDNLAVYTTTTDFAAVLAVKVDGLRHLTHAAAPHGLRFIIGFSSVAAWTGNVGQVAYCTANRAMAAVLNELALPGNLIAKVIWLPPIEGAGGMADDPETRELMRFKGLAAAFVHVDEFCELLLRELACGQNGYSSVMFARPLPATPTVLSPHYSSTTPEQREGWGLSFPARQLPMIEAIEEVDLRKGTLTAARTFRQDFDLWLVDHRPHKTMRHPLVSAVEVVELFLEGARLTIPYLQPVGLTDIRFMDMIYVPENVPRETRTRFSRKGLTVGASLQVREVSPAGRPLDRWTACYEGRVQFGPARPLEPVTELTFDHEAFDMGEVPQTLRETMYVDKTGQTGRYRIVDLIEGTGPEVIGGRVLYPDTVDFAGLGPVETTYPLYLLEAMMQLALLHDLVRGIDNPHRPLPVRIDSVRLGGTCMPGQTAYVRVRLHENTTTGQTWNAQALDEQGAVLLQALGITLAWTQ